MDENDKELLKLIASGGVSGGLIGGVGSLLGGAPTLRAAGKAAAIGSALSGGLAGLSGAIGLKALGSPSEEDGSGYTKRLGAGNGSADQGQEFFIVSFEFFKHQFCSGNLSLILDNT